MTTPLESMNKTSGASSMVSVSQRHGDTPSSYGDPIAEYRSVINGVAIHDASYLGRIKAVGSRFPRPPQSPLHQ